MADTTPDKNSSAPPEADCARERVNKHQGQCGEGLVTHLGNIGREVRPIHVDLRFDFEYRPWKECNP